MKRRLIGVVISALCICSHAQMIVNDPLQMSQQAIQFSNQWVEMINQECAMLESLDIQVQEMGQRTKEIQQEMMDIVSMTKKILVLYREIENCYDGLEKLRKDLVRSQYLSLTEKYTIYSRAQMVCYDILKRRNEIEEMVADCKKFTYNKKAASKEEKLDKMIAIVREVRRNVYRMRSMAVSLVNHKKALLETDLQLRKCLSLKLY